MEDTLAKAYVRGKKKKTDNHATRDIIKPNEGIGILVSLILRKRTDTKITLTRIGKYNHHPFSRTDLSSYF